MKVLIDRVNNIILGTYSEPVTFPISGAYVIDLPDYLGVEPANNSVSGLLSTKLAAFKKLFPTLNQTAYHGDLGADTSSVSNSSMNIIIPRFGRCILPGGFFRTGDITPSPTPTFKMFHYSVYSTGRDIYSDQTKVMYNYGEFGYYNPPNPADIVCTITQSGGAFHSNLVNDVVDAASLPGTFRIKFQNDGLYPIFVSDWVLLLNLPSPYSSVLCD